MLTRGSRYAQVPTQQARVGGREVTYTRLRLIPAPLAAATHRVDQGERLDQVAQRHFQDSTLFWHICDANRAMLPSDLVRETGRTLAIPFPHR